MSDEKAKSEIYVKTQVRSAQRVEGGRYCSVTSFHERMGEIKICMKDEYTEGEGIIMLMEPEALLLKDALCNYFANL